MGKSFQTSFLILFTVATMWHRTPITKQPTEESLKLPDIPMLIKSGGLLGILEEVSECLDQLEKLKKLEETID